MASGWNLWVCLQCIGVASRCCCKEVYRYPHNNYKKPKWRFLTSRGAHVNSAIMAILYTHAIGNQP